MTDYKDMLAKLNDNLNILQERKAKYGLDVPLYLLDQIKDHQTAITLTNQAFSGELSKTEWQEALKPLLISLQGQVDQATGEVTIGDVYGNITGIVAGRDVRNANLINTGDVSGSYNAIGAGAKVVFQQIHRAVSAIEELEKEAQLAERRLVEAIANKVKSYSELQVPVGKARRNPYKSLLNYELEDAPYFYGREEAIGGLLDRIHANRLTILHAESGSGKSSLLKAGISSRLLAAGHLPLYVRSYNEPPSVAIKKGFLPDIGTLPELARLNTLSLRSYLERVSRHLGRSTLYIFLDQFEEFFVELQSVQQKAFARELAACLNEPGIDVRWVLALRKEHFSDLNIFRPHIPAPFENDYFLHPFSREEAMEVITEPARKQQVGYEEGLVETILVDLSQDGRRLAPPQVQLVCYTLFDEVSRKPDRYIITKKLYQKKRGHGDRGGRGAKGILSTHLSKILLSMKAKEREAANMILAALVTSQTRRVVKSKDALIDELKQTQAEVNAKRVESVLETLVDHRLLRTYEGELDQPRYELAHDYLAELIVPELDREFLQRKLVREIVRRALLDWQERGSLLAPDNLRLVNEQRSHIRFSAAELEMIYAAAVSYDNEPDAWQSYVPQATRRHILLQLLLKHPDGAAQCQAANHLAAFPRALTAFPRAEVPTALARTAVSNQDATVREAAAQGVATLIGSDGREPVRIAINEIVNSVDSANGQYAVQALVIIRDQQPTSHEFLPEDLRDDIQRQVWIARWQRHQPQILSKMFRGALGGYIVGMALVGLFFDEGVTSLSQKVLETILLGAYTLGPVGTLSVGGAQFVRVLLQALQDYVNARRTWLVVTLVGTLLLSLGFALLILLGIGDLKLVGTGLLIGFVLLIVALAPLKMTKPLQLVLTILAGMIIFWLVGVGLLSLRPESWWLFPMGAVAGISVFWALRSEILS